MSNNKHNFTDIAKSIFLLPGSNLIGVAWTLVYEMYFYLIFSMTLWRRSPAFSIIFTTSIISIFYIFSIYFPISAESDFFVNPIAFEFCMGLVLGYFFIKNPEWWENNSSLNFLVVSALILLITAPLFVYHKDNSVIKGVSRIIFWGTPAFFLVVGLVKFYASGSKVSSIIMSIGDASYAIYLTHAFVIIGYGRILKIPFVGRFPQIPICGLIVAVTVGMLTHYYIEKPLISFVRSRIR